MKQIILTEKNAKKYPILYMVVFNLSGLHKIVYELRYKLAQNCWTTEDCEQVISFSKYKNQYGESLINGKQLGWNVTPIRSEFITPNKKEAELILASLVYYRGHVTQHI